MDVVTLQKQEEIEARNLRTNTNNNHARALMQDLFACYHTILNRND